MIAYALGCKRAILGRSSPALVACLNDDWPAVSRSAVLPSVRWWDFAYWYKAAINPASTSGCFVHRLR
jgi:hypothetical protein